MIVRMIVAKVPRDKEEAARAVWKQHCTPLMIEVSGCVSEQLLASVDEPGELIAMAT